MWFELYEIPTGSMRPTFKEKDRLIVSKTDFGINVPFSPSHLYFDPDLVQRASTIVFTGENLDIADVNTRYFYLFPGKKLYVKRLIGKPGDTLYFYGGKIYGIDGEKNDISGDINLPELSRIDHIPFIRLEGKAVPSSPSRHDFSKESTLYLMNQPIAHLSVGSNGRVNGNLQVPASIRSSKFSCANYGDLWGIKNFAMARLLSRKELINLHNVDIKTLEEAPLYLELRHDPNLNNATLSISENGKALPSLGIEASILPLSLDHLKTLFSNLYTARFEVKNGLIRRYGSSTAFDPKNPYLPRIAQVPDGCYEFMYGKAFQVFWQGITKELPEDHPLYQFSLTRIQLFFNLGIEFNNYYAPEHKHSGVYPSRYAYFQDKALYVMGSQLLEAEDPALKAFVAHEEGKAKLSPSLKPYFPFIDHKAPILSDGKIDIERIEKYGLYIPDNMYLMLGDNHAMSADSREFGLVPSGNLRGGPDFIFWPPGDRFGHPNQKPYPLVVLPRVMIWSLAGITFILWYSRHKKRNRLPLPLDQIESP